MHYSSAEAAALCGGGVRVDVELDKSNGLGLVLVEDDTNDGVTVVYDFAPLAGASLDVCSGRCSCILCT